MFLVGAKNQNDVKTLLDCNHIFLMSSITDSKNRAEAQGLVNAEAQAMGLPVVAFRSGGVPYTILENETGFLVNEKDIEAYANTIIKLFDDYSLYKTMSLAAKHFVIKNFDRDKISIELLKLYG